MSEYNLPDLRDPLRVVAQTTIGKYFISTVRTPMKNTFETCIFENHPFDKSEIVSYNIQRRDDAFEDHIKWCRIIENEGFSFKNRI